MPQKCVAFEKAGKENYDVMSGKLEKEYWLRALLLSLPPHPVHNVISMMDKATRDNRTDQCNPTHGPTGPGRPAGYAGTGTKADLDNHGEQMNPNNPKYESSRK